jgi:hypothetical protein
MNVLEIVVAVNGNVRIIATYLLRTVIVFNPLGMSPGACTQAIPYGGGWLPSFF